MSRHLILLMILLILYTSNPASATTVTEAFLYGLIWEEQQIEPLTREELIVKGMSLLDLEPLTPQETTMILNNYTDAHQVSFFAREKMAQAIQQGIISGYGDNTLRPTNYASTEETKIILSRIFARFQPYKTTPSVINLSKIGHADIQFYLTKQATTQFQKDLFKLIKDSINNYSLQEGTFSIYVKELNTGYEYTYNPDHIGHSASLAKLYLAAIIYDWADRDKLDLNQKIMTPNGYQTIGHLTDIMINYSDNDAYNILFNFLGQETVSNEISKMGYNQSTIERNLFPAHTETIQYTQGELLTSAKDAGKVLEKIYHKEFGQYSQVFLDSLTDSIDDSRLPRAIDYQVPVPHKIGTNNYAVHDAGIVCLEDNPYIIVIMYNSENPVQLDYIEQIQRDIAAKVYAYMYK